MEELSETTFTLLRDYLTSRNDVRFALLFGSAAAGTLMPMSDVDIGIYFSQPPQLLELGAITNRIEAIVHREVDTAVLNGLYRKRPEFCFQLVKQGIPMVGADSREYVDFKRESILAYLDVKDMKERARAAQREHIRAGRGGRRRYAGEN
jgi:predicted nucleotidyltransferase